MIAFIEMRKNIISTILFCVCLISAIITCKKPELPLNPYDLRHAWAVRTIHIGLPDTVAARMMGHSVTVHTKTYHHWITRRDQQMAVDSALARK